MAVKQPAGASSAPPLNIQAPTLSAPVPLPQVSSSGADTNRLVSRPVTGRDFDGTADTVLFPFTGTLTKQTFRVPYADLDGVKPMRGILVTQVAARTVKITQNFTGFVLIVPPLANSTALLPVFMGPDGIDLTFEVTSGTLADITAMLISEELVPLIPSSDAASVSNPNGQATMANSAPVVIASDQSAVPVTVAGGATSANQPTNAAQGSTTAGQTGNLGQAKCLANVTNPSFTADTTNPLILTPFGGLRTSCGNAKTATPTVLTDGSWVSALSTAIGATVTRPHSIPEKSWSFASAAGGIVNTTTAVTVRAAGAAGIRNYINGLQIATDGITAATELAIRDGAAGTVLWRGKLQAAILNQVHISFDPPLRGSAATLTEIVTLTATGAVGGVFVNLQGYEAP